MEGVKKKNSGPDYNFKGYGTEVLNAFAMAGETTPASHKGFAELFEVLTHLVQGLLAIVLG